MPDLSHIGGHLSVRKLDSVTTPYYYRARYYDQTAGRFISEDPVGFGAGVDFYRYVANNSVRLTDPTGLSSRDVQRILERCKKCTQNLTDQGRRLPGGGLILGGLTDLLSGFSRLKKQSCYSQAVLTQPCLYNNDPSNPYDDAWRFDLVKVWGGSHTVVEGYSSNPSDPVVVCDPWLNKSYTYPSIGQILLPDQSDR